MSVPVQLSPSEIYSAALAGVLRQVQNLQKNRTPAYGIDDNSHWQAHIEGALGEMALAKHLGIYWSGKGELRDPDVGLVDVRTTTHENGCLILHEADDDHRKFYLLIGCNGRYNVFGWMFGLEGKQQRFWRDPTGNNRHAFFVPQSALNKCIGE